MWQIIANLIGGPLVSGLIDAYKARLAAGNTADKIAADVVQRELAVEQREQELNNQVILSEEGRWWTALPRAAVQYAFAFFICKVVVWDTCFGWGSTPALKGDIQQAFVWLTAMWFGGRTVEKVARIFKSAR